MEETIIISREEYMELMKCKIKIEVLADLVAKEIFVSTDTILAALGIEVKENG